MNVKVQHIQTNNEGIEELAQIKRDLTRSYTGSRLTKIMGYVLAALIFASLLF
ncbi:hypothetical protein [Methanocaldococcus sp.]